MGAPLSRGIHRGWLGTLWAVSVAAGVWSGAHLDWLRAPPDGPAKCETERVPAPVIVSSGKVVDGAEMRRIVREELAEQLHRNASPASTEVRASEAAAAEAHRPAAPPSPQTEARLGDASQLIEQAIAAGRWTDADRSRFAQLTSALPPPMVVELERKVHAAINRDQLTLDDHLPPFGPSGPGP